MIVFKYVISVFELICSFTQRARGVVGKNCSLEKIRCCWIWFAYEWKRPSFDCFYCSWCVQWAITATLVPSCHENHKYTRVEIKQKYCGIWLAVLPLTGDILSINIVSNVGSITWVEYVCIEIHSII